jgi:hypothetical protein
MTRILTIIAALAAVSTQVAHAETPSPVLQSLPAAVQKNIEQVRTACRAYWNDRGIADSSDVQPYLVSSGDEGLIQFTVSGAQAVMVSNLNLCGGQCLKGVTCTTVPFYEINIYLRTGQEWRNVLSTTTDRDFLSLDNNSGAFRAMVLGISAASKDCPKRLRTWWKRPCDVIVRWNGTKFTYEALARD